jgi:protein-tyrosine-phosphatase
MTTNILFLCPHGAAKSTAAAAFLGREAHRLGLDLHIDNAGTDPDPVVNPIVGDRLEADRLPAGPTPRRVQAADLASADVIINIGCACDELPTDKTLHDWVIPNFSDDPVVAFAAVESHVIGLATGLAS